MSLSQLKNNISLICVPNPPIPRETSDDSKHDPTSPVAMLIRVKSVEDAEELLRKIKTNN